MAFKDERKIKCRKTLYFLINYPVFLTLKGYQKDLGQVDMKGGKN